MNKPSNWYKMDRTERQEWERNQQTIDDLEYAQQRAREDEAEMQRQNTQQRRAMQEERESMAYDYDLLYQDCQEKAATIARLRSLLEGIDNLIGKEMGDWYSVRLERLPNGLYNVGHIRDAIQEEFKEQVKS